MPADKHSRRSAAVEDRHRVAIDEGRAGDKVDQPDPAAAPMGTDAEAGGSSTDQKAARSDYAAELAREPESRKGINWYGVMFYVFAALAITAAVFAIASLRS